MKYTKYKIVASIAIGALMLGGCKKFLDTNKNPNIANNPGIELVLPSAQVEIAHVLGNNFQVNGCFWAQYWTQSPLANQYKQYDQYQPSTDNYNRAWGTLYNGAMNDLQYIYNTAKVKNNKNYMAISRLMSAYTFQLITDAWGDAPYVEALRGLESAGGIVSPKYDMQSAIYDSIISQINEATALIDVNSNVHPGADDLIYGGDMSLWSEFAYTLKLKVALRLSEVNPSKAAALIADIEADPNFNGFIAGEGEDAKIAFSTAGGSENPLYSEIVGVGKTQNLYASATCVDSMKSNSDPRVFVFYKPLSNGTVVGNTQGDYNNSTSASGKSIVSYVVGGEAANAGSAAAPVRLISSYESLLLQSEAYARGWLVSGGDDSTMFYNAIDASFEAYGITDPAEISYYKDSTYWGVYPVTGSVNDKIRHIITQKWFAMCGNQGFEAWTEQRRTGFPSFLIQSVNSLIGTKRPSRFVYPTEEINLNANFPGLKSVDQKVWWDVN
ncbi:hypothetical protein EMGBS15_14530 [Filimonas sp.]|nr:hypothetical protein EMGBS15_14530 [Filimonas sp.]